MTRVSWLIDISLDKLSLGRAHLHQAIEEKNSDFTRSENWFEQAVQSLREAGIQDHLTSGLLARGSLHRLRRDFAKAWADLEEALEIAAQGSMRLHLADYHLEAARLLLAQDQRIKAWENLEIAERMVEEMGYHRRDGEIKDLKADLDGQDVQDDRDKK